MAAVTQNSVQISGMWNYPASYYSEITELHITEICSTCKYRLL